MLEFTHNKCEYILSQCPVYTVALVAPDPKSVAIVTSATEPSAIRKRDSLCESCAKGRNQQEATPAVARAMTARC